MKYVKRNIKKLIGDYKRQTKTAGSPFDGCDVLQIRDIATTSNGRICPIDAIWTALEVGYMVGYHSGCIDRDFTS